MMRTPSTPSASSLRRRMACGLLLMLGSALPATADDPWQRLASAREALAEGGAMVARFEQSFLPAGFSAGEEESGEVAMALPDCLRWDYTDPYPKSYLICGDTVWSWNPGEAAGRKDRLDTDAAAGLDLLLLGIDRLRERYDATWVQGSPSRPRIELQPRSDDVPFREAALELDDATQHPTLLTWIDREGSRTSFRLGSFELLDDAARFVPPSGVEWEE